jgi:hypothetical protein
LLLAKQLRDDGLPKDDMLVNQFNKDISFALRLVRRRG